MVQKLFPYFSNHNAQEVTNQVNEDDEIFCKALYLFPAYFLKILEHEINNFHGRKREGPFFRICKQLCHLPAISSTWIQAY